MAQLIHIAKKETAVYNEANEETSVVCVERLESNTIAMCLLRCFCSVAYVFSWMLAFH